MRGRLLRMWAYFRRGHSTYLVFILSFANFIVIQYRLLVQYISAVHVLFNSILVFSLAFFLVYVPLAALIGWYDYKKLAVPVDQTLAVKSSPYHRDIANALILLAKGEKDKAIEILEKWA